GSSILFLRFARGATTDVQLALWVTAANAFLALALLHDRRWVGWLGAGAALGLAFMSKGPVAFVQTLVPFGLFAAWRWRAAREWAGVSPSSGTRGEGRGAGSAPSLGNLHSAIPGQEDPHPSPLPQYREREQSAAWLPP